VSPPMYPVAPVLYNTMLARSLSRMRSSLHEDLGRHVELLGNLVIVGLYARSQEVGLQTLICPLWISIRLLSSGFLIAGIPTSSGVQRQSYGKTFIRKAARTV
jgi:hypothetical protein